MALASGLAATAALVLSLSEMTGIAQRPCPAAFPCGPDSRDAAGADPSGDIRQDEDRDGVPDAQDHCPGTTPGFPAGQNGCEQDEDADGVADGADRCPATRPGARGLGEPVGPDGCSVRDARKERSFPFTVQVG